MAQIMKFPTSVSYAALRVSSGRRHTVSVSIIDYQSPEEARWHLQSRCSELLRSAV